MNSSAAPAVEAHLFVIFGATGDLAGRKLFPALYRIRQGQADKPRCLVLGVATDTDLDDTAFRKRYRDWMARDGLKVDAATQPSEGDTVFYQTIGKGEAADYRALAARIASLEKTYQLPGNRILYLALPPAVFPMAITRLGEAGLNRSAGWTRLVIEKPFGRDLASAEQLNELLHCHFDESQIYRIDHYLGKETVRNLLVFRFANSLFEPLWNRDRIASVEITVAESLGVEHRARYYETAGAMRDMIQNHLTQLLTLTAMEAPSGVDAESVRQEKAKVLRSVTPLRPEDAVFGQYAPGTVDGLKVSGYREEPGVAPDSATETFVALRLRIENWRWHGVPFLLRTGKRMAKRWSQIVINFHCPPVFMFQSHGSCGINANALVIAIQPDEGFDLRFEIKAPGPAVTLETRSLHFRYSEVFAASPEAYETLLLDVMTGDQTLFVRDDWVEASWGLYTPVLQRKNEVFPYAAGSWGPPEADRLLRNPGPGWTNS